MVRIAIVEDEQDSQQLLLKYLHRYETENGEAFEISVFSDGKDIVRDYNPKYDIILLDVKMKYLDGFSTAGRIRDLDNDVILIFITNMIQYAIKGYKVDALSYLLKPVSYFAFSQEIKRSLERIQMRRKDYLVIPVERGYLRLGTDHILFIESLKHRVVIQTKEMEYSIVATMKEMESKLKYSNFCRCNSCYLVNLAYVTGVQDNCAVIEKFKLQISRSKKKAFFLALTDYLGGARQ